MTEEHEKMGGILGDIGHAIEHHSEEEHHEAFHRGYEKAREEAREEFLAFVNEVRQHVHAIHELIKDKFGD